MFLVTVAICITKFESKHLPVLVQIEQNNVLYISDLLLFKVHGSKIVWNTRWSVECCSNFMPIATSPLGPAVFEMKSYSTGAFPTFYKAES
jgi:hypothetical protein